MERINVAWSAFRASGRFLFWTCVEVLTGALWAKKQAAMELTGLHPSKPADCFNAGYVLFIYNMSADNWDGHYRKDEVPGQLAPVLFSIEFWVGVPWHKVKFPATMGLVSEVRAVKLSYCEKHLQRNGWAIGEGARA